MPTLLSMLRTAARASALCGAGSAAAFGALLLTRGAVTGLAWALAYATVILAMLCVGGFAWIVLTLPPGAPFRRNALMIGGCIGAGLALAVILFTS